MVLSVVIKIEPVLNSTMLLLNFGLGGLSNNAYLFGVDAAIASVFFCRVLFLIKLYFLQSCIFCGGA